MLKLFNFSHRNVQKVFNSASEHFPFKCTLYKPITKVAGGIKVTHIRFKSFNPPHGAPSLKPEPIHYARPELKPKKGGTLLLVIPIITFGLGTWQVKRLKWKTELIKEMEEKRSMDPVPLPLDPEEVSKMEFQKVIVKGVFDHNNEIFYGPKPCMVNGEVNQKVVSESGAESFGYNLITPLVVSGTGERILVNRGWIRTKTVDASKRPWSKTEGEQTIIGVVRKTEPLGSIGPTTNPKYKVWHYRDIADMAEKTSCIPIYIDAMEDHSIPKLLWAGQTKYKLTNDHLMYLLTWYSLSIATSYMWYVRFVKK